MEKLVDIMWYAVEMVACIVVWEAVRPFLNRMLKRIVNKLFPFEDKFMQDV